MHRVAIIAAETARSPLAVLLGAVVGLVLLALPVAAADPPPARSLRALRVEQRPQIDARLDEAVWSRAPVAGGLIQRFPHTGRPASMVTRIQVAHDDDALYVAARCLDPEPEHIVARTTRRDRWIESDWFTVTIDSRRDRRTAYLFAVNAAGVLRDGTLRDENVIDDAWDGVWSAAARIDDRGWLVELRIPLRLLRYSSGSDVRFGIQFERWISRRNESDCWQHIPPDSGRWVSRFGTLTGLDLPPPPLALTVTPYAAARPRIDDSALTGERSLELGVDGKLGLGSNFMLTWTVNPDFGQVEVDEKVLNLSTYETFFPEKRPFFLEDRSLFRLTDSGGYGDAQLFYTRRIGRRSRSPELDDDQRLIRPAPVPRIYGAAKLAGETRGQLKVGLLQAVTSQERVVLQTAAGRRASKLAEPLTSYSVARLQQGFWRHSSAGLLATALATPNDGASLTGGGDVQLELFDDQAQLTAQGLVSYLNQARFGWQDQYLQAALERDGPFGYGGRLKLAKTGGEHVVGSVSGFYYSPNLALNDMGYLDRADRFMLSASLRHHRTKPLGPLARYAIQLNGWLDRSADFTFKLGDGFSADAWVDFVNGWYAGAWTFVGWPLCDDRETRSAGRIAFCGRDLRTKVGFYGQTSEKHPLAVGLDAGWKSTERGQGFWLRLPLTFNPLAQLQISLLPGYEHTSGQPRWLETRDAGAEQRFLFGDQHAEIWDITLRTTFSFTPRLSLQAFAQLFLAAVDHDQKYSATTSGRRIRLADLQPDPSVADEYDFTSTALQINVILRWEFRPGSLLYLVYNGALGDSAARPEFRFGPLLGDLFAGRARHLLVLKLTYFFG